MITAVDTNVLIDIFSRDERYEAQSLEWLQNADVLGTSVVCDVVYAELVPSFDNRTELEKALQGLKITISPIDTDIAYQADQRWSRYHRAGGPRTRILADFLIGAHAHAAAEVFLTRDQGFYSTYFPELQAPQSPI